MNTMELHEQAVEKLGYEHYSRLILSERSLNQQHWGQKLRHALRAKTYEEATKAVNDIIEQMWEESKRYEQG